MAVFARKVLLPQESGNLSAELFVPEEAAGVVVLAHDTRGPCCSTRAEALALKLTRREVAVLLLGLQTGVEEERILSGWGLEDAVQVRRAAERLVDTCRFLAHDAQTASLPVGLLGMGTGAAASFLVATRPPPNLKAVASCGGRPWLVGDAVEAVRMPTLLVAGGEDEALPETLRLSKRLGGDTTLRLVPHASRAFTEPGTLEDALHICGEWFHERFEAAYAPRSYGWADERGRWI